LEVKQAQAGFIIGCPLLHLPARPAWAFFIPTSLTHPELQVNDTNSIEAEAKILNSNKT